MSQYVSFYLKKDNTWVLLTEYSRGSAQYEMIDNIVPYGKLIPLTAEMLSEIFERISEETANLEKYKETFLKDIEIIADMPNPVEEKLDAIAERQSSIGEAEDELKSMESVRYFYSLLRDVMDTGKYSCNTDEFVWAGIEADPPDEKEKAECDE